jgi:hypothetical protein
MTLFKRDLPFRALLTVIALVLIASIVSGREPAQTAPPAARPAERAGETDSLAHLDLDRLKLAMRLETGTDVLGLKGAALPASSVIGKEEPAVLPPEPPEPPPPAIVSRPRAQIARPAIVPAPPLPFSYLGRLIDGGTTKVFIARGPDHYSAEPGLIIDDTYKVEGVTDTTVTFVFLPSGVRQVLAVPVLNN